MKPASLAQLRFRAAAAARLIPADHEPDRPVWGARFDAIWQAGYFKHLMTLAAGS